MVIRLASALFADYQDPTPVFTYNGPQGRNLLESALAQPRWHYHRGVPRNAVALLRSIVKNHPFVDGNKRVGLTTMMIFLLGNEWLFVAPYDEQVAFVLRIASEEQVSLDEITEWIRRYSLPPRVYRDREQYRLSSDFRRRAAEYPGGEEALWERLYSWLDPLREIVAGEAEA